MTQTLQRFTVVYLTLYCFATQIAGGVLILPNASLPALGTIAPMRTVTEWVARDLFRITGSLVFAGNSGDTLFHWVQMAWLLPISALIAIAWTALERLKLRSRAGDQSNAPVQPWFRLFVRFALAGQMFYYGMAKVIPTQFPPPSLVTLVEPSGNLSLSAMLWTSIGASVPYEIFTGVAEVMAGLLLLTPRTTPLGALIALADMTLVFVLNMTYDIGLKQISLHLIVLALILLGPDARRLLNVLVLNRAAGASNEQPLFAAPRAQRRAVVAQLVFGVYLLAIFTSISLHYWSAPGGGGAPKSALYGIWNVERMQVDGEWRPPVSNDYDRQWRRVIFDTPDQVVIQRLDDSFARYPSAVDVAQRRVELRKGHSDLRRAALAYERPSEGRLVLEGTIDDHAVRAELRLVPLDTFRLLNSSFRWTHPPE
jgi:uncharacterized membrane protein YphA (DoxX/SURF4 family)